MVEKGLVREESNVENNDIYQEDPDEATVEKITQTTRRRRKKGWSIFKAKETEHLRFFLRASLKPPKTQAEVALDEDKPNIEYFKEENEVVVTDREEPNEGETKDVENSNNSTR